ncbi:MAG: NAD(P)/FAD-dependent oxidoreductase [Verrucomicrobiales bacterium]
MKSENTPAPTRVAILGGGFAGLELCKRLNSPDFDVTLVDRQNHHLFQPLLYQVATAGLAAPEIAQPLREIVSDQKNAHVRMAEVSGVDLPNQRVDLADGTAIEYDYLAIALGAKTGYFGNGGWAKHATGLKTLDDAMRIRREVLLAFERAETEPDPGEVKRLMTIVVVGGGPTGVELAGAFAELTRVVFEGDFRRIDPSEAHIILVEAGPRLLDPFPEDLSRYTEERLRKAGVDVRTGVRVEQISDGVVRIGGQDVRAATVIWAAGVEASPVTKSLGVPLDRAGRVIVGADLSLPGYPNVLALGDIAACTDRCGVRVPGLCPAAIQMGQHAAALIKNEVRLKKKGMADKAPLVRKQFAYRDKGIMATIGRSAAVAATGKFKMRGLIAWLAWLFVHLLFLVGFKNKVSVFLQWVYSYVTFKRASRIIMGMSHDDGGALSPPEIR